MSDIFLEQDQISNSDINKCIQAFEVVSKKPHPVLRIVAKKELRDINILLPAYLIIFKWSRPELVIEIILEHNTLSDANNRAPFKLLQHRTYAYLMTSMEVYSVFLGKNRSYQLFIKDNRFYGNTFVLSDSFMLLLLVTKKNLPLYHLIFEKNSEVDRINWFIGNCPIEWNANPDATYSIYQEYFTQNTFANATTDAIINLSKALIS